MIIQIKLQSIEKNLDSYLFFIKKTIKACKIKFKLINLPSKKKKFTVIKSPHVNKKSRDQFQVIKYTKVVELGVEKNESFKINTLILNKPKYIKLKIRRII